MKIGLLSDLHVDINNEQLSSSLQEALVQVVRERGSDMLLLAGDVSNNYKLTLQVIDELEEQLGIPCLFVPGNHDLWNLEHPGMDTWKIYEALQAHPRNLAGGSYDLGEDWVMIGDTGWYDYAFAHPRYSIDELDRMERNGRVWKDRQYTSWGLSTLEVNRFFTEKLERQLEQQEGKSVILVTHVVPHRDFTVPESAAEWTYFNAFLGSMAYGHLIEKYHDRIRFAVCGHVHYRKRRMLEKCLLICNCLGYTREWRYPEDAYREIAGSYQEIEIPI